MSYVEPAFFEEKDIALLFVAGASGEAEDAEQLLTEDGVDYTLAAEPFLEFGLAMGAQQLPGVGFYVLAGQLAYCRGLFHRHGLRKGLVPDELS